MYKDKRMILQPLSFTTSYNGRARELKNKVLISRAFDPSLVKKEPTKHEYDAIWDTGATNCVISQKVINECDLKPIGMTKVYHAGGQDIREVYLINIYLPNKLCVTYVKPTIGILPDGCDVLIGMDIIGKGDFAVTNKDGKTVFSFRFPSIECIDFVKNQKQSSRSSSKITEVGRNDPCPCGSGKKYKKCHGK